MFTGPQFPNGQPDPNLPNMGIHPAPPAELTPQLGEAVYPGDEESMGKSGDLPPPATAGAEQDISGDNDVPEHIGAVAIPAASTEPSTSQPEEPTDNPQLSKPADAADSPPKFSFFAGGDGPTDPPETPIAPHEGMFPEREPIPAPDLYAVGERIPTIPEALAATATLRRALVDALTKHEEYTYPIPFVDSPDNKFLDLDVRTEDGYLFLQVMAYGVEVTRYRFRAEEDSQATNAIDANFYPAEVYRYSLERIEEGLIMTRRYSMEGYEKDLDTSRAGISQSQRILLERDENEKKQALRESMPDTRNTLNIGGAIVIAGLLEKAEVPKGDFGTTSRHIALRHAQQHSVPEIDARDAVVDLERVVAEELQRPEFQPSATNPEVEGEWKVTARARPEDDDQANFTIQVGHMAVEPPALMDMLSSGTVLQIPDTIEGIEEAATPTKTPFINIEVITNPAGEIRESVESQLRGRGTPLGPDNDLQIAAQQSLHVQDGKLVITYHWDALVDGEQAYIGRSLSVPGDADNVLRFKLNLRQPRHYTEVEDWRRSYQASQQKPETPEEERG
jgi:hypothetical protein